MKYKLRRMLLIEEVRNWLLARTTEAPITLHKLNDSMIYSVKAIPCDKVVDITDKTKTGNKSDSLFVPEMTVQNHVLGSVYADSIPKAYETTPLTKDDSILLCRRFAVDLDDPSEFLQFMWFSNGALVVATTSFSDAGPFRSEIVVFEKPEGRSMPCKILSRTKLEAQIACQNCVAVGSLYLCLPDCENAKFRCGISGLKRANSWVELAQKYREIAPGKSNIKVSIYGANGTQFIKQYYLARSYNFNCTDFEVDVIKRKYLLSHEYISSVQAEMGGMLNRLVFLNPAHTDSDRVAGMTEFQKIMDLSSTGNSISDSSRDSEDYLQNTNSVDLLYSGSQIEAGEDDENDYGFEVQHQKHLNNGLDIGTEVLGPFPLEFEVKDFPPGFNMSEEIMEKYVLDSIESSQETYATDGLKGHDKYHSVDGESTQSKTQECGSKVLCDQCEYVCTSMEELEEHFDRDHANLQRYICNKCDRIFVSRTQLGAHQCVINKEKPFKCNFCGQAFAAKSNMKRHVRMVHEKIRDFRCSICQQEFVQSFGLKRHMKRLHPESANYNVCNL